MDSLNQEWSFGQKLTFRYVFIFFSLIAFPFPLIAIPGAWEWMDYYYQLWSTPINLSASYFFGVEETLVVAFTGSGDRLYDWVWYFCIVILTLLGGSIWTLTDNKRSNYIKLQSWFVFLISYYLAYYLLVYGITKLFYLQFVPPNLERLFQTFGQASPMRLLWTFMGFSKTYTIFSGFCETIAGILLLYNRTRLLGALIAIGVMLNVFMLNMSYDVPVKLFSFQLMLVGIYLVSHDSNRLLAFFFLNQSLPSKEEQPLMVGERKYILWTFQIIFIVMVLYSQLDYGFEGQKQYGSKREKSVLYGVYNIDEFILNKDTLPPLVTDSTRWQRVLFDFPTYTSVLLMTGKAIRYDTEIDTVDQTIAFSLKNTEVENHFEYTLDGDRLELNGSLNDDTLIVRMTYYDLENFGLLNRGFHWINEVPYNRYQE